MKACINYLQKFKNEFEERESNFISHHIFWASILMFIGMPFLITAAVFLFTAIVGLPIAFLFGWI